MANEQMSVVSGGVKSAVGMMSVFSDAQSFEGVLRMADVLASSTIVPKEYQRNIGNCMIALEMAECIKTSPMMVMQNLYIINGRPGWSSQWIIAMINASGRYKTELQFEFGDAPEDGGLSCYAWAEDYSGHKVYGPKITMSMAEKEGWTGRNGSKWKTMPRVMVQYRAASFFGRMNCPDMIMGIYSADEVLDMEEPSFEGTVVGSGSVAGEIAGNGAQKALPDSEDPVITQEQRKSLIMMAQSRLGKAEGNAALIEMIKAEGYESSYEIRRSSYERISDKIRNMALKDEPTKAGAADEAENPDASPEDISKPEAADSADGP